MASEVGRMESGWRMCRWSTQFKSVNHRMFNFRLRTLAPIRLDSRPFCIDAVRHRRNNRSDGDEEHEVI